MDSYIIRVYRRDDDKTGAIVGVLEATVDGAQWSFRSRDELWNLLAEAPNRDKKIKKKTGKDTKQRAGQ